MDKDFNIWLGVIVPGAIFTFSFIITYILYLHFSRKVAKGK